MAYFSKKEYWNDRYAKDADNAPFEWYQRYENIKHLLKPEVLSPTSTFPPPNKTRVLNLGCGNSSLGEEMIKDNYNIVWNLDFSSTVIEQMKAKYKDEARLEFACADITSRIPFSDSTFDLIICKATLEAFLTGSSPIANTRKMMEECYRVLDTSNHGGMMVVISSATPENRMVYFEKIWNGGVEVLQIPRPKIWSKDKDGCATAFHVYISRKGRGGEDCDVASQLVKVGKVG